MKKLLKSIMLLLALVGMALPTTASAQASRKMVINYTESIEEADYYLLNVYFNVLDGDSVENIVDEDVKSAEFTLLEMNTKTAAEVSKPNTPFYISLVLDSSGSMNRAAQPMRDAAKEAIGSAPEGAFFSVVTFNDKVTILHDYSNDPDTIKRAIDKAQSIPNAGTCLYDAIFSSLEEMAKIPQGRRAIVVFTDGRDEKADGTICSLHSYNDVVTLANRSNYRIPIHTIGLSSNNARINKTELESMSSQTGGYSVIGTQGELSAKFGLIMRALASQWLGSAKLFPTQGTHNAALTITMNDGSNLSGTVTFTSSRAYSTPADPVKLVLNAVKFVPDNKNYSLELAIVSPQLIKQLRISIWDANTGVEVSNNTFNNLAAIQSLEVSSKDLQAEKEYEFRIYVTDVNGNAILNEDGEQELIVHNFSFNPTELNSNVEILSVSIDQDNLLLKLDVKNGELIKRYEGWLVDESTKAQVPNSEFSIPISGSTTSLTVPMGKAPAGNYSVNLRAIGENDAVLVTTLYEGIGYVPPKGPSVFSRLAAGLKQNPIILVMIILIILGVVGFLIFTGIQIKRATGTPVLESNIEVMVGQNQQRGAQANRPRSAPPTTSARSQPPTSQQRPSSSSRPVQPRSMPEPGGLPLNQTVAFDGRLIAPERAQPVEARQDLPLALIRVLQSPDRTVSGNPFMITRVPFTIGRKDCDLVVVNDPKISRQHAHITYDTASRNFYITDLGSANGLWFGKIRAAAHQPLQLTPGTRFGIGPDTIITFELS